MDLLIQHGTLVDGRGRYEADVLIRNGVIAAVGRNMPAHGAEVYDAAGQYVLPGLMDAHVHFRDPGFTYKETLHTGALSAAKGGFTSVICMANTSPVVDNTQTLLDIEQRAKAEKIRIFQAASVSRSLKGEELTDMKGLAENGACGFTALSRHFTRRGW